MLLRNLNKFETISNYQKSEEATGGMFVKPYDSGFYEAYKVLARIKPVFQPDSTSRHIKLSIEGDHFAEGESLWSESI